MAVRFEATPDRVEISQTRRWLRIAMWALPAVALVGLAINLIPRDPAYGKAPPLAGVAAGFGGLALIVVAMGLFMFESEVVIDRLAKTINAKGRKWPLKQWNLERPLADVDALLALRFYAGRGQYSYTLEVRFKDGTQIPIYSPAYYRIEQLREQTTQVAAVVGTEPPTIA